MHRSPRRNFLSRTAAAASVLALSRPHPGILAETPRMPGPRARPRMALQLWTVRREIARDLNGALRKVKSIGFNAVETAFFPENATIQQAGSALKNAGLQVSSVHCELPMGRQKEVWLETAEAYSCRTMVWHGWPEDTRYRTEAGIRQSADSYNRSGAFAKSQGMRFGLHNHWWEMTPWPDGRLPLAVLAEALDQDIFFEIDTYWAKVAGQDPAQVISRFTDRARLLHIKDGPGKTPDDSMVALGTGSLDFAAIAQAARQVEWMIVEFDKCGTDIFEALKKSVTYLMQHALAKSEL